MSCNFIYTRDGKFLIKHIFAFHIIKNNFYFYYPPIAFNSSPPFHKRFLLHWDWDGSPTLLRTARLPSCLQVRSSHWQTNVIPSQCPAASIHQLHQMPDPLVSISNSILIAFTIMEYHHICR